MSGMASWAGRFHRWMVEHDERWLFVILYISLAVVLSVWISLFWLVVVVCGHLALEIVRQRAMHGPGKRMALEVAWELKLDLGLILFALALALYMEVILGVLGLQSAARTAAAVKSGTRAGGRAVAWERVIRGVLLSLDDVAQGARSFGRRKDDNGENGEYAVETAPEPPHSWAGPWGWGDRISLGLGVVCLALMLASPLLTHHTAVTALTTLAAELHPFPGD